MQSDRKRFSQASWVLIMVGISFASYAETDLSVAYKWSISEAEVHLKDKLPDFRFVKVFEEYSPRPKATKPMDIKTNPVGAMATLHDKKTGEPLQTCETPCVLNSKGSKRYLLSIYKFGYTPRVTEVSRDMLKNAAVPIWLGGNLIERAERKQACLNSATNIPKVDGNATPCLQIPPMFPPRAKRSGHCDVLFDVTKAGELENKRIHSCTEKVFASESLKSLEEWRYTPKVQNGKAVRQNDVEINIHFYLNDEKGNRIPARGE